MLKNKHKGWRNLISNNLKKQGNIRHPLNQSLPLSKAIF